MEALLIILEPVAALFLKIRWATFMMHGPSYYVDTDGYC